MSLYALDERGCIVSANQSQLGKIYCCRQCGAAVQPRGGTHRIRHFYHLSTNKSCHEGGKTLKHVAVQHRLKDLLPAGDSALEWRFPTISRIADCVWFSEKIVFEIQCSDIDCEEVLERNHDYLAQGYRVVWILHDDRYNRKNRHPVEELLKGSTFFHTDIDSQGKGKIYDQFDLKGTGRPQVLERTVLENLRLLIPITPSWKVPSLVYERMERGCPIFQRDIVGRALSDYVYSETLHALEKKLRLQIDLERRFRLPYALMNWVGQLYMTFLNILLERACR